MNEHSQSVTIQLHCYSIKYTHHVSASAKHKLFYKPKSGPTVIKI